MSEREPLRFDAAAFERLFPFYLVLDRNLTITRVGPVLARIMPALVSPAPLGHHFEVRRPAIVTVGFESLAAETRTIFLLGAKRPAELVLKGQIAPLAGGDELAFLGSPWITSLDQLPRLGLTVADFAIHDSINDFLVLIQAQKTALDDAGRIAAELRDARDSALQASRIKSEFLAHMSHELRTPLNAILGFSETITAAVFGPISERYRAYAEHIHESGKRLLHLINDLLDLSRIEAGRYELAEAPVPVAGALADCIKLVTAEAQRKSLTISLDPGPSGLTVHADPRAFEQIALNLLSNAVKFTDQGGAVSICVSLTEDAVAIAVTDTGIGIPPELVPTLFEPFRQAHAGISRQYGGTGLGLSICRNLIDLHGGTIGIDSAPGRGTTVTVRFPATRVAEAG